jgi:hypothetical protein
VEIERGHTKPYVWGTTLEEAVEIVVRQIVMMMMMMMMQ